MEGEESQNIERELAVFSLALRLGRKEIPDLPKYHEMSREQMIQAAQMVGDCYFKKASEEVERATSLGVSVISCHSPNYPRSLLTIHGAPEVIYVRGKLCQSDSVPHIAIVGSRRPTREGRDLAERLGYQITSAGGAVISGLAFGCDAAAHRGAVKAAKAQASAGSGVAVLGSGVNNIYPEAHKELVEELITYGGAIVSEFGLNTAPHRGCFPTRNRIISGLSMAVIVIEAGERSGSLITARCAAEQGRDLYAVPGSFYTETAKGTNRLLKEGAIPLTDFLDLLSIFPRPRVASTSTTHEDPILACLACGKSMNLDELCVALSKTPAELLPKLIKYELNGTVLIDEGRFSLSI